MVPDSAQSRKQCHQQKTMPSGKTILWATARRYSIPEDSLLKIGAPTHTPVVMMNNRLGLLALQRCLQD